MNKRFLTVSAALVLTLVVAGGAIAATPGFGEGQKFGFGRMMGGLVVRVANFLGWEVDELQSARADGQTLAEILQAEGKYDAFVAASIAEREAMVERMIEEGKMTREQAEHCRELMGSRLEERLNSDGLGQGGQHCATPRQGMKKMMQQRMQQRRENVQNKILNKGL